MTRRICPKCKGTGRQEWGHCDLVEMECGICDGYGRVIAVDGKWVGYKEKKKNLTDYEKAKELGLTNIDRWGEGVEHHPKSIRLIAFLIEHDFEDYCDYFCWKSGGDGDNGETLMYQMDAFFELMDIIDKQ